MTVLLRMEHAQCVPVYLKKAHKSRTEYWGLLNDISDRVRCSSPALYILRSRNASSGPGRQGTEL